jgi:hypothetical protein
MTTKSKSQDNQATFMTEAIRFKIDTCQVEAMQFIGHGNDEHVVQWLQSNGVTCTLHETTYPYYRHLSVTMDYGCDKVTNGDWVIKTEQGEWFVINSALFSRFFIQANTNEN